MTKQEIYGYTHILVLTDIVLGSVLALSLIAGTIFMALAMWAFGSIFICIALILAVYMGFMHFRILRPMEKALKRDNFYVQGKLTSVTFADQRLGYMIKVSYEFKGRPMEEAALNFGGPRIDQLAGVPLRIAVDVSGRSPLILLPPRESDPQPSKK